MDTKIIDFCNGYLEKIRLEKAKKETARNFTPIELIENRICFDKVYFEVHEVYVHGHQFRFQNPSRSTIILDDEDLKCLYDKYSKRLKEEMVKNIEEVEQLYAEDSNTPLH